MGAEEREGGGGSQVVEVTSSLGESLQLPGALVRQLSAVGTGPEISHQL